MQRRARRRVLERTAESLAVDGDDIVLQKLAPARRQLQKSVVEAARIKRVEQVGKGVVARDAVLELHEFQQKLQFRASESRHVDASLAAAHDAQQSDHQHFAKVVARRVAAPGVFNSLK